MKMNTSRITDSLKLDVIALLIVGAIGLGYYFHKSPINVKGSNPEVAGTTPPPGVLTSDTLLVLPRHEPDRPPFETFAELDMSLGWFNILTQEVGSFSHIRIQNLDSAAISNRRLVIITAAAARRATTEQISSLGDWVSDGGILMVEQPMPSWENLLHITVLPDKVRTTRHITAAEGAPLRRVLREALLEAPLITTMIPFDIPASEANSRHEVILEVDGSPAFLHIPRGRGHIYATSIDIARAVMTLQQGKPGSDFSPLLTKEGSEAGDLVFPSAFIAAEKMRENRIPYADLIERNTIEIASLHTPLPRLWYFPGTFAGVYIVSHDEDGVGDRVTTIADWEADRDLTSTFFISAESTTQDSIAQVASQGHDVQLQWRRPGEGSEGLKPVGIGPWRPLRWELSLDEQKRQVENKLVQSAVTISRLSQQDLDPDWSGTFQKLAAVQIIADSSYGPSEEDEYGYLFGTGMPFYPLDHRGLLIPVAEIPFVINADHGFNPSVHLKLIKGSESGHHQVLVTCFNAGSMSDNPSVAGIRAWQKAAQTAARYNHWVTTLKDYLLFEESRRTSTITSEFFTSERRLEIKANISRPRLKGAGELDSKNKDILPAIAIPQIYEGTTVESVRVDGAAILIKSLGRSADGFYHTVSTGAGEHVVHVIYQGKAGENDE